MLTGTILLYGKKQHDLYECPTVGSVNNNHVIVFFVGVVALVSQEIWHGLFGYPSLKILNKLVQSRSVSFSSSCSLDFVCHSFLCNRSQLLPFGESSLASRGPLDLIHTNVWVPFSIQSIDGFNYYIIFIYHFTKYMWCYPLCLKSDVFTTFHQYKAVVENFFNRFIISIYSNGGGEYIALKDFFNTMGIQHLKTLPYTPQYNGVVE